MRKFNIIYEEEQFYVEQQPFSKQWLYEEYIVKSRGANDLAKEIGVGRDLFFQICKFYGLSKQRESHITWDNGNIICKGQKIDLQTLLEYYQAHDVQETQQHFQINRGQWEELVSQGVLTKNWSDKIEARKKTMLQKYGAECSLQVQEFKDKKAQTCSKKWQDVRKSKNRIFLTHLEDDIKWEDRRSQYEDEICNMLLNDFHLDKSEIKQEDRRELDFYLPQFKLRIEFNGNYWHSDAVEKYQDHQGRSRYHQQQSLDAESKGIFIFHIFEYEWTDPTVKENIKNRLKNLLLLNQTRIAARKCVLKEVTKEEKKQFFNINHIQGNDRSSVVLGLYYDKELVCCMSFVKPKTKYTWELSRFCTKHSVLVQGGASRLFSCFIKEYTKKGDTIVSYNDITKTKGTLYQTLGFQLKSINPPNYIWMNFKTNEIRTRYQEQKGGEVERMHSQGFHRICDCGTKTWVYIVGEKEKNNERN